MPTDFSQKLSSNKRLSDVIFVRCLDGVHIGQCLLGSSVLSVFVVRSVDGFHRTDHSVVRTLSVMRSVVNTLSVMR